MTNKLLSAINSAALILEDAAATAGDAAANGAEGTAPVNACESMAPMLIIYALLFGLLYLFMIRPQQKKRKAEEEMKKNIEVGDDITTIGGICGRVVSIKDDDSIIIETGAEKNKIKFMRWAILQNNTIKEAAQTDDAATKKKGLFSFLKK